MSGWNSSATVSFFLLHFLQRWHADQPVQGCSDSRSPTHWMYWLIIIFQNFCLFFLISDHICAELRSTTNKQIGDEHCIGRTGQRIRWSEDGSAMEGPGTRTANWMAWQWRNSICVFLFKHFLNPIIYGIGKLLQDHYSTRYRSGLDLVLRDIVATIRPSERVGIVGRTGAGMMLWKWLDIKWIYIFNRSFYFELWKILI